MHLSCVIFLSSLGYSVIAAMKENGGDINFKPSGYIGADPLGPTNFLLKRQYGAPIPERKIEVPTLAIGFTIETCAVTLDQAGLAAYNVTADKNRVMMQVVNKRNFGNQITHCIFTGGGCTMCPSHDAGAWVRGAVGNFCTLFVNSIVKGDKTSKEDYERAVGDEYTSLVNAFFGAEVATV